ncbi:MAG: hypothetical protein HQL03_14550 [Nitrospirae bacterium]|nr:hypothetical protein [Nitrospirota bacterium]MBF0590494.1 hypothetical protein [Nitrospirota bacterium]
MMALMISIIALVGIILERILTTSIDEEIRVHNGQCINMLQYQILYLFKNADNLCKNSLLIGSFLDQNRRLDYLPQLIGSFLTKNIHAISVLDSDNSVIYSTMEHPPDYSRVRYLKIAMGINQPRFYVSDNNNLVYIVPIYLETSQGSLVIEYDLAGIFDTITTRKDIFYRLYADNIKITEKKFDVHNSYVTTKDYATREDFILSKLNISVELGMPRSHYKEVVLAAILKLVLVGIVFIIATIFNSHQDG